MTAGGGPGPTRAAARRSLLREGQRVGDNWVVERFLGEGAYAEVYRVRHRFLGRQAMKVFKQVANRAALDDLLAEARLLTRLGHPNIVRVFDAGTTATATGRRAFFTMEYVGGGTLERFRTGYLRQDRQVPVAEAARILHQVSSGLAVAHAEQPPIVHRDITTQNILIGYDGSYGAPSGGDGPGEPGGGLRARLGDFGLATRTDRRTELASAQGVLAFKPPETLLGFRGDSRTGDVWALGVVGYLLLTGRFPYPKGLAGWMSGSYRRAPPAPPSSLNPEVDACLDRIVLDALRVSREHRTADAGVLAARFARRAQSARSKEPAEPAEPTEPTGPARPGSDREPQ